MGILSGVLTAAPAGTVGRASSWEDLGPPTRLLGAAEGHAHPLAAPREV